MQIEKDPELPKKIVLDLGEPLQDVLALVSQFTELGIQIEAVIADLIECMQYRDDAEYEISYSSYDMMPPDAAVAIAMSEDDDAPEANKFLIELSKIDEEGARFVAKREELGRHMLQLFTEYRLYKNNRLFYQIAGLLGTAVVLEKIGIPVLLQDQKNQHHVNTLSRQLDIASRYGLRNRTNLSNTEPVPVTSFCPTPENAVPAGVSPSASNLHRLLRAKRLGKLRF